MEQLSWLQARACGVDGTPGSMLVCEWSGMFPANSVGFRHGRSSERGTRNSQALLYWLSMTCHLFAQLEVFEAASS